MIVDSLSQRSLPRESNQDAHEGLYYGWDWVGRPRGAMLRMGLAGYECGMPRPYPRTRRTSCSLHRLSRPYRL